VALNKKWKRKVLLFLTPWLFKLVVIPLFWTLRKKRLGDVHHQALLSSGKPFIITFWHYGVLCAAFCSGRSPQIAMASASRDGDFIAAILNGMGIETVRGSRSRGGIGALKGLIKGVKRGLCPVLVADGSQGPPRVAQAGGVLLASRTGIPILPMVWAFQHYKVFRSWDRTVFPLPFSPMIEMAGEPLAVPPKLDSDGIEEYRKILEDRLNGLYEQAWGMFGITEHGKK
jgi:lysophospholipid acyltransferase (LPLAT)-like uncharacterized protein